MNRLSAHPWLRPSGAMLSLVLVTACGGPSREGPPPAETAAVRPVVTLRGRTNFFDNRLTVEVAVGHGVRFGNRGEGASRGGHHGGGGYGRRHGGSDGGNDAGMIQSAGRPPVTLIVTLRSTSPEPLDLQILDVKSDLGNFAVRPERVLLAPDQESELDPMVSRLVDVGDDLPVTISLRLGARTETHDVILHTVDTAREDK